jgi:transcriptional regulator with XRE-family HTH domain
MAIIPQNTDVLKALRRKKNFNQTDMAEALTDIFKRRTGLRHYIQQPDVCRLERGDTAIDVFKLLAYSYLCKVEVSTLLSSDYQALLNPVDGNMQLREFDTDKEAEQHLIRLEQNERLLISPTFPSTFFKLEKNSARRQQLNSPAYESNELCTFDSFVSFLFSPVGNYSIAEKKKIIQAYRSYFQGNNFRHLNFFTRSSLPKHCQLTDMVLLPEKQILLIPGPISHDKEGDSFIEIHDKQVYEKVTQFYRILPTFEDSMLYLRLGLKALDRMSDNSPAREAIRQFSIDILNHRAPNALEAIRSFTPEIQHMINQDQDEPV